MSDNTKYKHFSILGGLIAVGLIASAAIQGNYATKSTQSSGQITVQGFAEVAHKSTLATWRVSVNTTANSYAEATEQNKTELLELIKQLVIQGLKPEAFDVKPISVVENLEIYVDDRNKERSRKSVFKASRDFYVTTNDLDTLTKAFTKIQDLKATNKAISFDAPRYYLENVEKIKFDLIANATKDAKAKAEEFAKNSGVKVGKLTSATQEAFVINAALPGNETPKENEQDTSSIEKKVRLVVTNKYTIE